jgi:hypothetical protein
MAIEGRRKIVTGSTVKPGGDRAYRLLATMIAVGDLRLAALVP